MLRRRRWQGSDVLGQRGEAKPDGSEWAPVAGWRYGGDGVWRRTSEGSERRERWGSGARPLRAWVVAAEGNEEEGSRDRERAGDRLGFRLSGAAGPRGLLGSFLPLSLIFY